MEFSIKILVAGANSFIASHVIPHLASQGHEIKGIKRNIGTKNYIDGSIKSNLLQENFFIGDLSDEKFVNLINWRCDVIINCAINAGLNNSSFERMLYDNSISALNVLNLSKRIECQKIIFLSSLSVHGQVSSEVVSQGSGFVNPSSYGITKRVAELIMQDKELTQSIFTLRLPAVLGKNAKSHWVSRLLVSALKNEPILYFNSESLFNNVVHIDDLCRFITQIITMDTIETVPFPIASLKPIKISEVVNLVIEKCQSHSKSQLIEPKQGSFIINDDYARVKLGYKSLTTTEAIILYTENLLEKKSRLID